MDGTYLKSNFREETKLRRFLAVALVVIAFGAFSFAQDLPKAEIFGGYQFTSLDAQELGAGQDRVNLNGWNAAVTGYFNDNFGITADFSGAYGKPDFGGGVEVETRLHSYLFGPTVRFGGERATPFVRALFGGISGRAEALGIETTDSSFGMALGGGFDVNASPNFAIRVAQFDYMYSKLFDAAEAQNNFRYSAGVVIRF